MRAFASLIARLVTALVGRGPVGPELALLGCRALWNNAGNDIFQGWQP